MVATAGANELDADKLVRSAIDAEMERGDTIALAKSIDADYENAICDRFSTFGPAREYLISKEKITEYYNSIKVIFKHLHYAMATLMSSRYYSIDVSIPPEDEENEEMGAIEELHHKERIIVFLCLGMIRAKSNRLLRHYAMIEPFAYFSKGYQQPGRRCLSGSLSSTLKTSMKRIKTIYDRCLPTFNDQLSGTKRCHGAFDNHQQILPKKNPGDGKSAVCHVGTSSYLKEDRPYMLPHKTKMISPLETRFNVVYCAVQSDARLLVRGQQISNHNYNDYRDIPDADLIRDCFLYPEIGWCITSMPGHAPHPRTTYVRQVAQPPLYAKVDKVSSDSDIIFSTNQSLVSLEHPNAEVFETLRMQKIHKCCCRLVDMRSHVFHLQSIKKRNERQHL